MGVSESSMMKIQVFPDQCDSLAIHSCVFNLKFPVSY